MLYIASVRHRAAECPGNDPKLMKEMAAKLSHGNLARKKIHIMEGFIDQTCFLQQSKSSNADHICTFVVEVSSPESLDDLFAPFAVEIIPSIKWQQDK